MDTLWDVLFKLNLVLFGIFLCTLPFIEPGTASFVAAITSLVVILISLTGLTVLMRLDWTPFEDHFG